MAAHQVNITDRAKRYRAQNNVTGPRKCVLCGSRSDLGVMHLTGNESHGEPANLAYGCRSCNAKLAVAFKKIGAGKPTNQYNPAKGGTPTFEQYAWAVSNGDRRHWVRGQGWAPGAHDEAGAIIHATPKHKRIEYARRIAATASRTKRDKADDRWNPAKVPVMDLRIGDLISQGEKQYEVAGFGGAYPNLEVYAYPKGSTQQAILKFKRTATVTKSNPWPWGHAPDARRTTPAHGGIAYHQGKAKSRRKSPDDLNAEFLRSLPKGKAKKSASSDRWPSEKTFQEGFRRGLTAEQIIAANPVQARKGNPSPKAREYWYRTPTEAYKVAEALRKQGLDAVVVNGSQKAHKAGYKAMVRIHGRKKLNPAAPSAKVFEEFHGYEPTEVIKVSKERHHHEWVASAGDLVGLQVKPINGGEKRKIEGLGECFLAFNEAKNQLFIEGGDQRMSPAELKKFGIKTEHELHTLGKLVGVGYFTEKTHLGDEGGEAVYTHTFRSTNENGKHVIVKIARYPDLIYRVMDEQFEVSGGSYEILREGINK